MTVINYQKAGGNIVRDTLLIVHHSESEEKLPALRDVTSLAESGEVPGWQVLEYIKFLASEMTNALEIAQEDAREQMESDEPSVKIQAVSNLKARRRKLEQHLRQEVKEIKGLIVSLRAVENKAVAEAVSKALQEFLTDYSRQLDTLVTNFDE